MDKTKLRGALIKLMLACLIVAAAVAVVTILIGKFSDTTGRALGTIFVAFLHISILFGLVSMVTSKKIDQSPRSTEFVVNTGILITALSFFTSVLSIWGALNGDLPLKLYTTYAVVLFALMHVKTLLDVGLTYEKARSYIVANYFFIAVVALMIFGAVYAPNPSDLLSTFYGRLLGASAVVDVTLSIVTAVMYRAYLQQHPELVTSQPARSHSVVRIILALLLFFFVVGPLLLFLVAFLTI